jgi:hypothetical protein
MTISSPARLVLLNKGPRGFLATLSLAPGVAVNPVQQRTLAGARWIDQGTSSHL